MSRGCNKVPKLPRKITDRQLNRVLFFRTNLNSPDQGLLCVSHHDRGLHFISTSYQKVLKPYESISDNSIKDGEIIE